MELQEAADAISEHARAGRAVRPRGGSTKLDWGGAGPEGAVDIETSGLARIVEHNVGDFTAVLEAGVRVADAQAAFGAEGQMLALDPPLGAGEAASVGGMIATADSGPLRHRYGGVRDLVVGMTVVLSDGTISKSGGKVIKNVAGYDLGKLFTGSYGTLGLIGSVAVRLHPRQDTTATAAGSSEDPDQLARAARELAALPLEADCLDVAWARGSGRVLVRFAGASAEHQAGETVERMRAAGLGEPEAISDDAETWAAQRAAQRSPEGAVLKVAARATDLAALLREAESQSATVVSRAALGLSWVAFAPGEDLAARVHAVRDALAPRPCTVLDGAAGVDDPWPEPDPGTLAVMRRVKQRFDPARIFRPGAYVGGI